MELVGPSSCTPPPLPAHLPQPSRCCGPAGAGGTCSIEQDVHRTSSGRRSHNATGQAPHGSGQMVAGSRLLQSPKCKARSVGPLAVRTCIGMN